MSKGEKKTVRRRLAGAYISSVISISLVLLLVGVASLLLVNARRVGDYFKESMQISLICRQEVDEGQALAFKSRLDSLPYVKSAGVISREQGEKELGQMLGEDFLDVFVSSPVPVSVDLSLKAQYVQPDSIAKILPLFSAMPEVESVESRTSLVEGLNKNISVISLVMGVFILLLLFISVVLIGNTVRLSIFAKRFTIRTMNLVGASKGFIRKPFLGSAALQGLISGLLACAVLAGALYLVKESFPQIFALFDAGTLAFTAGVVLLSGVVICVVTTYFVVGRIVSVDKDALYY